MESRSHLHMQNVLDKARRVLLVNEKNHFFTPDLHLIVIVTHSSYSLERLKKLIFAHISKKCYYLELVSNNNTHYVFVGRLGLLGGASSKGDKELEVNILSNPFSLG